MMTENYQEAISLETCRFLNELQTWRKELGLPPTTVKRITHIREVPNCTAIGAKMGVYPDFSSLTPEEIRLVEKETINKAPIVLIVDIDGVLVPWRKTDDKNPGLATLLPFTRMAKVADRAIILTNRVTMGGIIERAIRRLLRQATLLEPFPFISRQTAERIEKTRYLSPHTTVFSGLGKQRYIPQIVQIIEDLGPDTYVVYIGSSNSIDGKIFREIIEKLKEKGMPINRIVFCSTCHPFI